MNEPVRYPILSVDDADGKDQEQILLAVSRLDDAGRHGRIEEDLDKFIPCGSESLGEVARIEGDEHVLSVQGDGDILFDVADFGV